jgi:hypothetical protein
VKALPSMISATIKYDEHNHPKYAKYWIATSDIILIGSGLPIDSIPSSTLSSSEQVMLHLRFQSLEGSSSTNYMTRSFYSGVFTCST